MIAHDLISAAQAAHAEDLAVCARELADAGDSKEQEQVEFLQAAADFTAKTLGSAADGLPWTYVPEEGLPEHTFAATAALAPGRAHDAYLTYRFEAYNSESLLALVRTCRSCTHELVNPVDSLAELGRLLEENQAHSKDGDDTDSEGQEPGPLAAIESVEHRVGLVARLARRLLAEYPDAGLTVQHTYVFGHGDGGGRTDFQLKVNGLDTLSRIASALGAETDVSVSNTMPGMVFEHGSATCTVDGIDVTISGYSQMPEDRAAAWLAQQNQATATEAGDV